MREIEHHETWLHGTIPLRGSAKSLELEGMAALLSDSEDVDTAVVFVHGFLGDAQGTWLNFQEDILAPSLRGEPWRNSDVFFFTYPSFRQDITESAEELLGFLAYIFPNPPKEIFAIEKYRQYLPPELIQLSSAIPTYKRLVLVGHSEGGVVIRRAVDLAWGWKRDELMESKLALFAPAHKGVKLSGWIGACLAIGRVDAVVMPILRFSPAFSEMKDKDLLNEIKEHTETYLSEAAAKGRPTSAFKAHVVFGEHEDVVVKGYYATDCYHPAEKGRDHRTVCKPERGYRAPIEFVLDRVKGDER